MGRKSKKRAETHTPIALWPGQSVTEAGCPLWLLVAKFTQCGNSCWCCQYYFPFNSFQTLPKKLWNTRAVKYLTCCLVLRAGPWCLGTAALTEDPRGHDTGWAVRGQSSAQGRDWNALGRSALSRLLSSGGQCLVLLLVFPSPFSVLHLFWVESSFLLLRNLNNF